MTIISLILLMIIGCSENDVISNDISEVSYALVSIDINPSIDLKIAENQLVLEIIP